MKEPKKYSQDPIETYLVMEEAAEYRSEYIDGEIISMVGGTLEHDRIGNNIRNVLFNGLEGKDCEMFSSDLKIQAESSPSNLYADAMVICGDPKFADNRTDIVTNPILIVEVLSDGTEPRDRGIKFKTYQAIESFREYVLISQKSREVEIFFKKDDKVWLYTRYTESDQEVYFASLDLKISLDKIYAKVEFNS